MGITSSNIVILLLLFSSVVLIFLFLGISLFIRFKKYHSRPYLVASLVFLIQLAGLVSIITDSLLGQHLTSPFEHVFVTGPLIAGFFPLFANLAYLIELKRPEALNLKNFLIGCAPVVIVSVLLCFFPEQSRSLHSLAEVRANIGRTDVWLRMVLVFLYLAYPVAVTCATHNWRICLVPKWSLIMMEILNCILPPIFIGGLMAGFFPLAVANFFLFLLVDVFVAFIEFKVRIPASKHAIIPESGLLRSEFENFVDNPEIWMNPDMTAVELAKMLGTNRTYLSDKIKALGYASYTDMIHRKRVAYICKQIDIDENGNLIQYMFDAGFRSRSTASSEFKRIVGCTPLEYVKSRK